MENIRMAHRRLYNDAQLEQLAGMVELLHDQTLFICDVDPEIDITSPYFKPEEYPIWAGGDDNFCLGVERTTKILFLSFLSYTATRLVGQVHWTFKGDELATITITLYQRRCEQHAADAIEIKKLLLKTFTTCKVSITTDDIKNVAAA